VSVPASTPIPTDFGPGKAATRLYTVGSVIGFSVTVTAVRQGHLLTDLPLPPVVLAAAIVIVSTLACGYAGSALSRRHKQREQQKRDSRAADILSASQQQIAPDFSLFLRAFETTGRMPFEASTTWVQPGFDPRHTEDRVIDIEAQLAHAVEQFIPLVALGRPAEQFGAGRALTTEERWKEDIGHLGNAALVIFMFPSARPGTLWELDWLREHRFLRKTVFLVPPDGSRSSSLRRGSYEWSAVWSELRVAFEARGIEIPEYDKSGQLFSVADNGRVTIKTRLKGHYTARFLSAFIGDHLSAMAKTSVRRDAGDTPRP
jgi:hypothetical protein